MASIYDREISVIIRRSWLTTYAPMHSFHSFQDLEQKHLASKIAFDIAAGLMTI